MSQYGANGFAKRGSDHAAILGHYYAGTQLGALSGPTTVRVLLRTASRATFSGAAGVAGGRSLDPAQTYVAVRALAGAVALRSSGGRDLGTYESPLRISGRAGRDPAARPRRQRRRERALPRRPRAARRRDRRHLGDQRRRPRGLRPRRRRRRDAAVVARRGAARAGGRRAHVRDRDVEERRRLRPVRRHALADVPRHLGRGSAHRRRRRRDRRQGRHLRRQADRDVLLLDLRRAHGERRELVSRRPAGAVPDVGRRPLRRRLAAPSLDRAAVAGAGRSAARLARQGPPAPDQGAVARALAARRARAGRRQRRAFERHRPAAALEARPVRHVGALHGDHRERRPRRRLQAEAGGRAGHGRRDAALGARRGGGARRRTRGRAGAHDRDDRRQRGARARRATGSRSSATWRAAGRRSSRRRCWPAGATAPASARAGCGACASAASPGRPCACAERRLFVLSRNFGCAACVTETCAEPS